MKKLYASAAALLATAGAAMANADCGSFGGQCSTPVPEISAMEGTAALVALASIVLLTWERRRRAS